MSVDRLEAIRDRLDPAWRWDGLCKEDMRWLVGEVDRLRRVEAAARDAETGIEITGNDPPYFGVRTTADWPLRISRLRAALADPPTEDAP
jgi:hypothetical protein